MRTHAVYSPTFDPPLTHLSPDEFNKRGPGALSQVGELKNPGAREWSQIFAASEHLDKSAKAPRSSRSILSEDSDNRRGRTRRHCTSWHPLEEGGR